MEVALALQDKSQLPFASNINSGTLLDSERQTLSLLDKLTDFTKKISHLYFGSEFCQYRIPTLEEVEAAYTLCKELQYTFTFVTPYVPQSGLNKLIQIFSWLNEQRNDIEIVVNDWGVCYHVTKNYDHLLVNIGRLLNKMIRDPRIAHLYDDEEAPERAKSVFMSQTLSTPYFAQFLKRMNVNRIEFDSFIQPIEKTVDNFGMKATMYVGYGVVATGRSCLVGTLHKAKEDKFRGDIVCKQQCVRYVAKMDHKQEALGQLQVNTYQKGTTAFYEQTDQLIDKSLKEALELGVDRLVISPKIPV